jgi:hypothetical protein
MTKDLSMRITELVVDIGGVWLPQERLDPLFGLFSASFPFLYSGIDFRRSKPAVSADGLWLRSKPELGYQFLLVTSAILGGAATDRVWVFTSHVEGGADVELQRVLAAFDDLWYSDFWIVSYDAQWCLQFHHEDTVTAHLALCETG